MLHLYSFKFVTDKILKMSKKPNINFNLINVSELARQVGFTPQYVSMVINGKRKNDELMDKIIQIIKTQVKAA